MSVVRIATADTPRGVGQPDRPLPAPEEHSATIQQSLRNLQSCLDDARARAEDAHAPRASNTTTPRAQALLLDTASAASSNEFSGVPGVRKADLLVRAICATVLANADWQRADHVATNTPILVARDVADKDQLLLEARHQRDQMDRAVAQGSAAPAWLHDVNRRVEREYANALVRAEAVAAEHNTKAIVIRRQALEERDILEEPLRFAVVEREFLHERLRGASIKRFEEIDGVGTTLTYVDNRTACGLVLHRFVTETNESVFVDAPWARDVLRCPPLAPGDRVRFTEHTTPNEPAELRLTLVDRNRQPSRSADRSR